MGGSDKEVLVRIVRIISENKPFDNAVLVEANLEEIYINIMS